MVLSKISDFYAKDFSINRCKIIATLGPSSSDEKVISSLIDNGLNIARLNFSHGNYDSHLKMINLIRKISYKKKKYIGILQDLQGPKIRCGELINSQMEIVKGKQYILSYNTKQTNPNIIPIDYPNFFKDVKIGHSILMDDGLMILKVEEISSNTIKAKVIEGGILKNRKGVNFPDSILSLPAITEKDTRDIIFGIENRVDFIALSFVQSFEDIKQIKSIIEAMGADIPVIAKIERLSAVNSIDEIASVSDGLMVARGDLGVECKIEKVPVYQRKIINTAYNYQIPVIIATQMLESMIDNPIATLAEISDVANSVLDQADCLMLSGETASGKYPLSCVKTMSSVIDEVESWNYKRSTNLKDYKRTESGKKIQIHESVAKAAVEASNLINASAIVCLTITGSITRSIAKQHPKIPIIAISPRKEIIQRLTMISGVYGIQNPFFYNTDILLKDLPSLLKKLQLVKENDMIIVTAGIPVKEMLLTNTVQITKIY